MQAAKYLLKPSLRCMRVPRRSLPNLRWCGSKCQLWIQTCVRIMAMGESTISWAAAWLVSHSLPWGHCEAGQNVCRDGGECAGKVHNREQWHKQRFFTFLSSAKKSLYRLLTVYTTPSLVT